MKVRFVVLRDISSGIDHVSQMSDKQKIEDVWAISNGYVQISEVMEVECIPLADKAIFDASLLGLKEKDVKIDAAYQVEKDKIETTRQNLLSLPSGDLECPF